MKGRFFWTYTKGALGPKCEGWFQEDGEHIAGCVAIFHPFKRSYLINENSDGLTRDFPEQVKTSEEMKKFVETLLRLKGVI